MVQTSSPFAEAATREYVLCMASRTTLLDEALDLPADERADLAVKLLESLPEAPEGEVATAWDAEIRKRVGRMLDGEAKGSSWSDVRARVLERLARR
jgi:putative addiction module component (TIGR02574 family)